MLYVIIIMSANFREKVKFRMREHKYYGWNVKKIIIIRDGKLHDNNVRFYNRIIFQFQ